MATKFLKRLIASERGAVALEFIMVLPIYMLLLGGTLLIFELIMGLVHLQEANRNLAWVAGDRHFSDINAAKDMLNQNVTKYYSDRNIVEKSIGNDDDYWTFGKTPDKWAVNVASKQTPNGLFQAETEWSLLAAGNMELSMSRISSAYIGMLALSSVMYNQDSDSEQLYQMKYDLTRTAVPDNFMSAAGEQFQPESYLYRRRSRSINWTNPQEDVFAAIGAFWPTVDDSNRSLNISNGNTENSNDTRYQRVLSDWAK